MRARAAQGRTRTAPPPLGFVVVAAVVSLTGCQRGCLMTWLTSHGFGTTDPAESVAKGTLDIPCPGGLSRCADGVVSISRSYTPPQACSPEGCRCPWDPVGRCDAGCVAESIELEIPRDVALRQLCTPAPRTLLATPVPPGYERPRPDGGDAIQVECEIERFRCVDGVVSSCDGAEHPLAICARGCAEGEGAVYEDVSADAAIALLCARP